MKMMEQVVGDQGTAWRHPGYRVAGRPAPPIASTTPAAVTTTRSASFIGVAPADDPVLAVGVIVQNPSRHATAVRPVVPFSREVMVHGLRSMNVPPSGKEVTQDADLSTDLRH